MNLEALIDRLNYLRKHTYWLMPSAIFFILFMGGDYFLDVYREYGMDGKDYFYEPIKLASSDVPICGSKKQKNTLFMLPKYDIYVTYDAQLMRLEPDGSYIDVRGAVRNRTLMAYRDQAKQDFETDWNEIKEGNVPPGTYHWRTIITFRSRTGQWENTNYRGNDFEVRCDPVTPDNLP